MSFPGFAISYRSGLQLPRSYDEARALFEAKSRHPRWTGRIGHNTRLLSDDPDAFAVELHSTSIVTFHSDGRIELSTGGWQTATTRDRFRRCGLRVYTTGGVAEVEHGGRRWTFADGMILHPDGGVSYHGTGYVDPDPEKVLRRRRRNLRRGEAMHCDSRQSSCWSGGNVPEAFEREEAA